jgi:hypothetical protein
MDGFCFGENSMIRMTILLPVEDTKKHVKAICELSEFNTIYNQFLDPMFKEFSYTSENSKVWIIEQKFKGKRKTPISENISIGNIAVLPARDNSVIVLTPEKEMTDNRFDDFIELVRSHLQALGFLLDTKAEPWTNSPPDKQERDRTIWEHRNLGYTWEQVAEIANCGVSTAKERYRGMAIFVAADSG